MRVSSLLVACGLVLCSTLLIRATTADTPPPGLDPQAVTSIAGASDCGGEPCDAVARGRHAFGDRRAGGLDGNGRACADCHMPTDSFQLSPASVEARFQLLHWRRLSNPNADDPLFRPIDADDFRTNGDERQRFQQSSSERSHQDYPPAAAEHQADRSRDQRCVE